MGHSNAQNLYFHMAHILIKVKLSSLQSTSSKYRQLTPCTESYMGWFQQKKKPEIAVIFLHSSLTAQNWVVNSDLTAPLSHLDCHDIHHPHPPSSSYFKICHTSTVCFTMRTRREVSLKFRALRENK